MAQGAKRRHVQPSDSGHRPLLPMREAAAFLGTTTRWLKRQVSERKIPFHRFNRLLYFAEADLSAYIESARVPARDVGRATPRHKSKRNK